MFKSLPAPPLDFHSTFPEGQPHLPLERTVGMLHPHAVELAPVNRSMSAENYACIKVHDIAAALDLKRMLGT
jgi:hypothetical protein